MAQITAVREEELDHHATVSGRFVRGAGRVEVWSRLAHAFGGPAEFDPYLAEMGAWVIKAQDIELKIINEKLGKFWPVMYFL
ncbi:MAG: hypothetical protein AAB342_01490 [Chloroflexota bacterium]